MDIAGFMRQADNFETLYEAYKLASGNPKPNRAKTHISLVYGFNLKDSDNIDTILHIPCKKAVYELIAIRKYRRSVLSLFPMDIVLMIAKGLWNIRDDFLPIQLTKNSWKKRYHDGRANKDKIYLGFEYGTTGNIFENVQEIYSGELLLAGSSVPREILTLANGHYNHIEFDRLAFLINFKNDDEFHGSIMYGYYYESPNSKLNEIDVDSSDFSVDWFTYYYNINGIDMISHYVVYVDQENFNAFIGITLDEISDRDSPREIARVLHNTYSTDGIKLPSKADIVNSMDLNMASYLADINEEIRKALLEGDESLRCCEISQEEIDNCKYRDTDLDILPMLTFFTTCYPN